MIGQLLLVSLRKPMILLLNVSHNKKAAVILLKSILKGKTLDEMGEMLKSGELFDCGPKRRQRQKKKY